ncbi:hypothetical protein EDB81DRAFT_885918 [Dactylonectria macrodidyma]|uniref:Uncharacterized protein n=1 Tax=Dactylonectria macrodidyma TaxID=307937 RepID=A0A9P9EHM0_9HYPO|nr:hypothetical protein EDB81DRAFT_885918 [Dactylonectria macrodidyma]
MARLRWLGCISLSNDRLKLPVAGFDKLALKRAFSAGKSDWQRGRQYLKEHQSAFHRYSNFILYFHFYSMDSFPFSMNGSLQTQIGDDMPCLNHSLLASQLGLLSCSQRREQAWMAGFSAGFDHGYRKGTDARTQVSGDGFTAASEMQPVGLGHYSNIEPDDIALSQWPILETAQHIPPDLAMFIPVESTAGSFEMSNFGFGGDMSLRDSKKPPLALDGRLAINSTFNSTISILLK